MARKKVTKAEKQKLDAAPTAPKQSSNFGYVVIFASIGIASIVAVLWLRPDSDPLIVVGVIGGLMTTIIYAFLGYVKADEAVRQSVETYHLVNSRMTMSLEDAVKAALGEGRRRGRRESEARTDKLAKLAKAAKKSEPLAQATPLVPAKAMPVEIVKTKGALPVEIVKKK